jgi:hypothetical protein
VVHVNDEPAKDEHHDAAMKVQQVHRKKLAKKQVAALKEVCEGGALFTTIFLPSCH